MSSHLNDQKYFRTTGFYPATFLFVKGIELVDIEKFPNSKRAEFIFNEPQACEHLIKVFNFCKAGEKEALVDAREMITAIKSLKEKLYQSI